MRLGLALAACVILPWSSLAQSGSPAASTASASSQPADWNAGRSIGGTRRKLKELIETAALPRTATGLQAYSPSDDRGANRIALGTTG
jgi:hypothetical protein